MKKTKVAVVLGGRSVEHPVSCASAAGVIAALDPQEYEVTAVGITQAGQWVTVDTDSAKLALGDGSLPEISADSGRHVVLSADPTMKDVAVTDAAGGARVLSDVDVVFPVLHGAYGEDGTIQGLLEMAEVPYVGSGVLSSAASMDKEFMKRLLRAEGIPIGDYAVLRGGRDLSEEDKNRLGLPVFVKPARAGSSLGITKVTDWSQLPKALAAARAVDPKVIVEAAFTAVRELECGVLAAEDGGEPDTTPPFEVLGAGEQGWFDFDAKYLAAGSPYDLSPELPEGAADRVRELAARVFTTLDCSDLARVDFFLAGDGTVFVNEINTMPGLTPGSGVPVAWAAAGLEYPELVARLVRMAAERGTGLR
ncbi:MAG: D-alanine--D-alanine ligase family protein [Stackebrandtia sp.]